MCRMHDFYQKTVCESNKKHTNNNYRLFFIRSISLYISSSGHLRKSPLRMGWGNSPLTTQFLIVYLVTPKSSQTSFSLKKRVIPLPPFPAHKQRQETPFQLNQLGHATVVVGNNIVHQLLLACVLLTAELIQFVKVLFQQEFSHALPVHRYFPLCKLTIDKKYGID